MVTQWVYDKLGRLQAYTCRKPLPPGDELGKWDYSGDSWIPGLDWLLTVLYFRGWSD